MIKLLKILVWILLTTVCLVCLDQFLTRVPLQLAGAKQAQTFYVDFRHRLLGLIGLDELTGKPGKTIEQVIETNKKSAPAAPGVSQRYLYVDKAGVLQFADSLEQVPVEYRANAQPLSE